MSLRILQPRTLRPHLSTRYLVLHHPRQQSTAPASQRIPTPPPPPKSYYRSALLWSAIALAFGATLGTYASHVIAPPALPEAGSHEDTVLLLDLNKRIDEEFKVKVLRGKCLGVTKQLKGEEGGWVEIVPSSSEEQRSPGNGGTLMHTLRAAKNLGVERVFWDRASKNLVAIVHFGPDLVGWPGVTHGGLLATALTEKIALANALTHPSSASSISSAAVPQRLPGTGNHAKMPLPSRIPTEPAQISMDYVKPTFANNFHVIRVAPCYEDEGSNVKMPIRGHEWEATLETMDARVCVRAEAKFEPRGAAERVEERIVDGTRWSYGQFKDWMWPSRQKQSQI